MSNVIFNYHKLCADIKSLNQKIIFVGVINERGRLVTAISNGKGPFSSDKDNEMLFMEIALRTKMRKEFDKYLGSVKFSLALRDKSVGMNFPLKEDILYVLAKPEHNFCKLTSEILSLIKNHIKENNNC